MRSHPLRRVLLAVSSAGRSFIVERGQLALLGGDTARLSRGPSSIPHRGPLESVRGAVILAVGPRLRPLFEHPVLVRETVTSQSDRLVGSLYVLGIGASAGCWEFGLCGLRNVERRETARRWSKPRGAAESRRAVAGMSQMLGFAFRHLGEAFGHET